MFSTDDAGARVAALRMVTTWSGDALARLAESAYEKLLAVLTPDKRQVAESSATVAPGIARSVTR